ncbi:hypothetical protein HZ326_23634 [Fusarium oxysporum f. sp. albedinis]|nr:hypothetical protein HZ326_23634 [Fusarium oxysporum f. sp. albedinis]
MLYKPFALVGLLLPSLGLADTFDACSTSEITTCNCPTTPVKRFQSRDFTFPEHLFPRTANSCSGDTPPCCVEKGPGPVQVSPSTSKTNLQCGSKFGDDQLDVTDGVAYTIEDCPASGPYSGKKCLHIAITTVAAATISDIHLQVDDDPITLNTKLGKWPFNSYCTLGPTECWVPFDAIIATFENPSVSSLCDTAVYVAVGISVSSKRCASGATFFNQGTAIGSGNWFMYFTLDLECPEICLRKCCCPALPPPSPETKSCSIGTAFGYGDGFKNLNGDPVGPALGGSGCNRWGWYFTPSKATLTAGISGSLIVGAGQNDIFKGTKAGTWSASLSGSQVNVQYNLYDDDTNGHFDLAEVHVYASCSAPTKCAPGDYTYVFPSGTLTGSSDTTYSTSIQVDGTCSSYYLILHAKVNEVFSKSATCPEEAT